MRTMKFLKRMCGVGACVAVLSALPVQMAEASEPVGTTFTYQGRLTQGGDPVSGTVDLTFRLFSVPAGGTPLPGAVLVADNFQIGDEGVFTIDLDFGSHFTGAPRWLEVDVNGTTLAPRQPIMPAPYAMVATTAANVPTKAVVGSYVGITGVGTLDTLNVGGNVGIGVSDPIRPLHVRSGAATGASSNPNSSAVFERNSTNFVTILSSAASARGFLFGDPQNNAKGGIIFNDPSAQGGMQFRTGGNATRMTILENGDVGIGTINPDYRLHVSGSIFAETSWWAIRGHRTGTSGTFPGVWGLTESASSPSAGVRGEANHVAPGTNVSGVYGINNGENNSGHGVYGLHNGGGRGVYGRAMGGGDGVYGLSTSGAGIRGASNSASGYGGIFGDLGSPGRAILAVGQSHMLDRVGVGTTSPNSMLHVNATVSGTNPLRVQRAGITRLLVHDNSNVGIGGAGTPQDTLHVFGTTRTNVIRIMGGSDLAERFDVADVAEIAPMPGMVVCIDPENPGKLIPSTRAYDRTVAGVISGANGINSGMIMGQEGSEADGAFPVALTGRVYVLVDATAGAIEPGDMLTTSDRPGHAMKVSDFGRSQGAVIGKAMTPLEAGRVGYVLVLVSLQ